MKTHFDIKHPVHRRLIDEQADLVITDPKALVNARAELKECEGKVQFIEDPYEGACTRMTPCSENPIFRWLRRNWGGSRP